MLDEPDIAGASAANACGIGGAGPNGGSAHAFAADLIHTTIDRRPCRDAMTSRRSALMTVTSLPLVGCASLTAASSPGERLEQVRSAEQGFAASMARRDFTAFASHVAEDAVFVNGGKPLRGKEVILQHWKRFFAEPAAPFAWKPDIVEIAANGTLGHTEGNVWSAAGVAFARFYSTWLRVSGDTWLIVFDNGYNVCSADRAG